MLRLISFCLVSVLLSQVAIAQSSETDEDNSASPATEAPMTLGRMAEITRSLDPNAEFAGTRIFLTIADIPVVIITDPVADRMRAMVPIGTVDAMKPEEVIRVLQANFDTALDARYAIAQGRLWAVFIHPLSPLQKDQFISALGQTVNIARTYGTLYSGGALSYGGGDSQGILRGLIEDLLKKGEEI